MQEKNVPASHFLYPRTLVLAFPEHLLYNELDISERALFIRDLSRAVLPFPAARPSPGNLRPASGPSVMR